jgi:aminoglycoside phosphotransferase (APT) family kinase protein
VTAGGGNRRSRRPQLGLAERIALRLYDCVAAVDWVPSDEADVFRLTFTSGLEPRYLKLPLPGTRVVAREVAMLPELRARGFPVPVFEHCHGDLDDPGTAFHVTREVEHVTGAGLMARDPSAGHRLAARLGQFVRRLEGLDAGVIPGSVRWNRDPSGWWRPQYRALLEDRRWPNVARRWAERILARLDTPPEGFGGWFGEMLIQGDGSFVMIDWTTAGANWACAQAAIGVEVLSEWSVEHTRDLVRHFLRGYAPAGLLQAELADLRLWHVHGSLGWTMLQHPSDEEIRRAVNSLHRCENSDDPAHWF